MADLVVKDFRFQGHGPLAFEVHSGEIVALGGPSGAGKTLLLRALVDLDPHDGDVRLGARRCVAMPAPTWRRCVGLLPAEPRWWHATVGAHFASAEPPDSLQRFGFEPQTWSWQPERLSSGESQRLALLRLLMQRPEALLLDEPTAHLDERWTRVVEQIVAEYCQDCDVPVLWVTHDLEQARRIAVRRLVLQNGCVADAAK